MPPLVSATVIDVALRYVSATLAGRLTPLADSGQLDDAWEALTAAVYLLSSPSNPRYVSREARLNSFRSGVWDRCCRSQSAEDMVESGFFCLQDADHVKCFFCDLGLRDWDVGDVPEREHAKFSPLCFFLKSSRGLDWLRNANDRPPNFPTSYTRQDHNLLLRTLCDELNGPVAATVAKVGFSRTKVLLCVARKFIRFRQKFSLDELLTEMHREWDRELSGETEEQFFDRADLAELLDRLIACSAAGFKVPAPAARASRPPATSAAGGNHSRCRVCRTGEVEIVCLPCGHLSLCAQCGRSVRTCPATGCGDRVDSVVRAFVS